MPPSLSSSADASLPQRPSLASAPLPSGAGGAESRAHSRPQRIALIGCAGAGKSTVARELGAILGLPVHHLDALFWKPGWVQTEHEAWARLQETLCRDEHWILDGNYGRTLDLRLTAADTIVFFDFPRWLCLTRVLRRSLFQLGRTRADMAAGCHERFNRDYVVFLKWIWNYRRDRRPGILAKLEPLRATKTIVVLQSTREVTSFLAALPSRDGP